MRSRTLTRPMFRMGGSSGTGITSGLDRPAYQSGNMPFSGDAKYKDEGIYGIDYQKKIYMEGYYSDTLKKSGLSKDQLYWFSYPEGDQI